DTVIDRLLAGPTLGVQTRIHYQPARAKQRLGQLVQLAFRIAVVPAGFGGEPLRVEPPTFNKRRVVTEDPESPETGQIRVLQLEGNLEVMPRHGFVIDRGTA